MYTLHHAGPRAVAPIASPASPVRETTASTPGARHSADIQSHPVELRRHAPDPRDQAAIALYEERGKLLAGLLAPAAEPWEDLPEDVKQRWRRTSERADTNP